MAANEKKIKSTYEQISADPKRKARIDKEYQKLLISESQQAKQYRDFREYLIESLKDIERAKGYLRAILEECKDCDEEESKKLLNLAIEDITQAQDDKKCKELLRDIQIEQESR